MTEPTESVIAKIRKLVPVSLGPETDGATFISLRCYCGFEGHGRASETWEEHWELKLPRVPFHCKSTTGWRLGDADNGMTFHGSTMDRVCHAALDFLIWYAGGRSA